MINFIIGNWLYAVFAVSIVALLCLNRANRVKKNKVASKLSRVESSEEVAEGVISLYIAQVLLAFAYIVSVIQFEGGEWGDKLAAMMLMAVYFVLAAVVLPFVRFVRSATSLKLSVIDYLIPSVLVAAFLSLASWIFVIS